MKSKDLVTAVALLSIAMTGFAADWAQYRGPNNDGTSPEKILLKWPKEGPRVVWKAPLGDSFGSFAVSGGKVFAFVQRNIEGTDREVAIALDANSGKELWATPLGNATYDTQGGNGPRSTPAVDGKRVYFLGAYQALTCLDVDSGKQIWQHDLVKEFGGTIIRWKNAASPIIEGDLLFANAGGSGQALLAFDKTTGKVIWKTQDDKPTHSSPVPATIHGVRQIIFFTQKGLVSVLPKTGEVLWRYDFPFDTSTASSPIVWKDIVYCSVAYDVGAGACKIAKAGDKFTATELWRNKGGLMNHWTSPVCKDGYVYGIYGRGRENGPLKCIDIATGKEQWSRPNVGGGGATILVGGNILLQTDRGPLVLLEANPKAYTELARAQVFGGQCWTMPVVSNGRIFARNTKEGFCIDVSPSQASR